MVDSIEELLLTANLFAQAGQIPGKRLAVVGISGGACDLAADLAEKAHISLPIFTEQTKNALRELLPVLGPANNPLDVTGAAVNNQALMGKLLDVVCHDPQLDAVLCVMSLPANEAPGSRFQMSILAGIGQALQNSPIPGFLLDFASNDVSPVGRSFLGETSTPFASGGMRQVIPAMAKVMDWTQFYQASQVQEQAQRRLIIAAEHASFGLPEPRVGLIAGAGGAHRLPQQIPLKLAMGMLLTGKRITAQEAYRMGLVNEVVPGGELMAAAGRWANEMLECSPLCLRLTKEAALAGLNLAIAEAMQKDRPLLERLQASEDFVEGPKAFAEKRKPHWTGR